MIVLHHLEGSNWSPNLHNTNYRKIKYTQNEALRIATGWHKMSSIDHLHIEAEMMKVKEHSELLSAQYLARSLEPGNVCHPITTRATPERQMKEIRYTRHRNTDGKKMIGKLQARSGRLGSYKNRIKKDASLDVGVDCGTTPHDVKHLFVFPAHPTTLIPSDLWSRPTDAVRELSYIEARDPD